MRDFKGYYAVLEVAPDADQVRIRTSYRRLAKRYHPDGSDGLGEPDKIRFLNQAYDVVGDPAKRAEYDRASLEPEASTTNEQALEPLRCHACAKITAFPRHLVFWRVISLLVMTWSTPVQGLYCASCAKREAMRSTVITAIFGWWGLPWGPIMTVGRGFENATGGKGDRDRYESLAWYNALALLQSGQVGLAVAIAERLIDAKDVEIREAASSLVEAGRANGVTTVGQLKDPWQLVRAHAPLRFGALFAVPAALIIAIAYNSGATTQASSSASPSADQQTLADSYAQPVDAAASMISIPPPIPTEICGKQLANGQILSGRKNLQADGHALEISNGSAGDAIVKLRNAITNRIVISFFVQQNQTARIDGIKNGTYRIQYSLGHSLNKSCNKFIVLDSVGEFPQIEPLESEIVDDYRGRGIIFHRLTYTLYSVAGGNVQPESISQDAFDAD